MIEIVEDSNESPLCPHCERTLTQILSRRVRTTLGVRYLYFCSECRKVLGVSHRKGFWMG